MSTLPTFADVLQEALNARLANVHTSIPAVIHTYDQTTQTAQVRINIRFARREDGVLLRYSPPILSNVPVAWPSASSYSITYPLAAGDTGLLIFSERSLDEWKQAKQSDEVEPAMLRRFHLSDAVFLPQGRSPAEALGAEALASGALVVRGTEVRLGDSTATSFVALATLVATELNALRAELILHTHPTGIGPSGPAIGIGPTSGSVASTKVKAV